jgi:hypothetical protein
VRLFIRVFLAVFFSGNLLGAFAQATTTRSGFAVVTLVSGNPAGLIATETLRNRSSSGVEQSAVAASPLITSASILVPVGPVAENTTAIAIANPSMGSGGVNLVLTDVAGNIVLNATITLGPRGQFSRYLNELFATPPPQFATPLLLTVSSEIPVAILPLNFLDGDFSPIPLVSLSTPTPVPVQSLTSTAATITSTAFGLDTLPSVFTPTIGGVGSLVFAQVVTGGNWSSDIAIGNTSAGLQSIRIDFFSSDGFSTSSLTGIVIQPRGVFFFSTDTAGAASQ